MQVVETLCHNRGEVIIRQENIGPVTDPRRCDRKSIEGSQEAVGLELALRPCRNFANTGVAELISYHGHPPSPIRLGEVPLADLLADILLLFSRKLANMSDDNSGSALLLWLRRTAMDCLSHGDCAVAGIRIAFQRTDQSSSVTVSAPCSALLAGRISELVVFVHACGASVSLARSAIGGLALSIIVEDDSSDCSYYTS